MSEPAEKRFTLEQIKQACLEFDETAGEWPEHQWEGLQVFLKIAGSDVDEDVEIDTWGKQLERLCNHT